MNRASVIFRVTDYTRFKRINSLVIGMLVVFLPAFTCLANSPTESYSYYSTKKWSPTYRSALSFSGMICLEACNLSLDASGKVKVTPAMVLKVPHGPESNYIATIVGRSNDTITCQLVGQRIKVQVTEIATNNVCWTFVLVEDKMGPVVTCRDTTLMCTGSLSDLDSIPGLVVYGDNCTPKEQLKVSHIDQVKQKDCSNDTFATVTRTWTVLDPWGRAGFCTQKINLLRPAKSDIHYPSDTTIYCPVTNTSPSALGQPTINGLPVGKFCGWIVEHKDLEYQKCGNTKKIVRYWSLLDCCSFSDTTVIQFIIIADTTRPFIVCRTADTVSTTFGQCEAFYQVKTVLRATDSCHQADQLTTLVQVDHGILTVPGANILLSVGTHILDYEVSDPCGNKSYCSTSVTVRDKQPPTLLCIDSMQLSLPADQMIISASNFSSIQPYDNCGLLSLLIRRQTTRCGVPADVTSFKESVTVCCADVGFTFNLIFLATDIYGNKDSCTVRIMVVDKSAPRLDCSQDDTIFCTQPRPVWHNPITGLTDNCVDSVKIKIDTLINSINLCGIGQIQRRIIATDPALNRDTCFQLITVFATDTLTIDDIVLPHDTIKIVGCSLDSLLPGKSSYVPPLVNIAVDGCNRIFVNYIDSFRSTAGTSRCRITKRTWRVGDSCVSLTPVSILSQIIIQDTTAFAPLIGTIAGQVVNFIQEPIEAVRVDGQNQKEEMIYHQMTDRLGQFKENQGLNITAVHLAKTESNILNGISTLDLLLMQRHISGINRFNAPALEYAADINQDGDINIFDLILLRKIILGLIDGEQYLHWVFTSPAALNTVHPGSPLPIMYSWPDTRDQEIKFIGFRMGDVNIDAIVNSLKGLESRNSNLTDMEVQQTMAGVTVSLNTNAAIGGMQLSLVSTDGWTNVSVESDLLPDIKYSIIGDELRLSWVSNQPINITNHTELFKIKGSHSKTVSQGSLSSQWYDDKDLAHSIQFKMSQAVTSPGSVIVYPNPVRERLNIKFDLSTNEPVKWRLVNQIGMTVSTGLTSPTLSQGFTVPTDRLKPGIYYLELSNDNHTISRHVISKIE